MEKNDYMKIGGALLTFVCCFGIGYGVALLVRGPKTGGSVSTVYADVAAPSGGSASPAPQPVPQPSPEPESEDVEKPELEGEESELDDTQETAPKQKETPKQETEKVALIASVSGPALYPTTSPERFGYMLSVSFASGVSVESAELLAGGQVKYSSKNGKFNDVLPVEGGSYTLRVKAAGSEEERVVKGFNLMAKWSADFIASQLNSPAKDKQFFRHFSPDLKLRFEGISDASSVPSSLSSLVSTLPAMGWTVSGVSGVSYDKYNRILAMTITITE